jgi:short-subunit dehydrogenase
MNYLIFGATSKVAKEFILSVIQKEKNAKFILSSSSEKKLKILKKNLLRKKVLISLIKIDFNKLNYKKLKDLKKLLNNNS